MMISRRRYSVLRIFFRQFNRDGFIICLIHPGKFIDRCIIVIDGKEIIVYVKPVAILKVPFIRSHVLSPSP